MGHAMSPLESKVEHLVGFDHEAAYLGADFENRLYFKLTKNGEKTGLIDQKRVSSHSELREKLPIQFLSADVVRLFQDYPEARRKELNQFCSLFFSDYGRYLKSYEKALKQKNYALQNSPQRAQISLWNDQLIEYSTPIIKYRLEALLEWEKVLQQLFPSIMEGMQSISLRYQTKNMMEKLSQNIDKEIAVGRSLYGPHRDDFLCEINGKSLYRYYSRGTNRTFAILLKWAQWVCLNEKTGRFPILLLDDAFAELDRVVKKKLIDLVAANSQFFYTTVLDEDAALFDGCRKGRMEAGRLSFG